MIPILMALAAFQPSDLGTVTRDNFKYTATFMEKGWLDRMLPRVTKECSSEPRCTLEKADALLTAVNAKRTLRRRYWPVLFSSIEARCEDEGRAPLVTDLRECYSRLLSTERQQVLRDFGIVRRGITRAGYTAIREGMDYEDVAFILGEEGDQSARSSYGGHSAEIYTWQSRSGGIITVSFANYRVSGKAQAGL